MNDQTPVEPATPAPIDFDRAEPVQTAGPHDGGVACGLCHQEITTEYWQSLGKVLCDNCRSALDQANAHAGRGGTFGKALLLGGGAALGCGIGYAIFVGLSHIQFALLTIGIGWVVGRVIHKTTRGFGGVKFQVLAVALTYFASTMGYLPAVLTGFSQAGNHAAPSAGAADSAAPAAAPSGAPSPEGATPPAPGRDGAPAAPASAIEAPASTSGGPGLAVSLLLFTLFTTAFTLAAPFLELGDGIQGLLGLAIIFFGMRTAWRVSKGVEAIITGPHRVAPAAGS